MSGRDNQKARTRNAILQAAVELIRSGGEVTMPAVAKAALVCCSRWLIVPRLSGTSKAVVTISSKPRWLIWWAARRYAKKAVKRGPTAWRRTNEARLLASPRDLCNDFAEQTSFELADGHVSLSRYLTDEARGLGWSVPSTMCLK